MYQFIGSDENETNYFTTVSISLLIFEKYFLTNIFFIQPITTESNSNLTAVFYTESIPSKQDKSKKKRAIIPKPTRKQTGKTFGTQQIYDAGNTKSNFYSTSSPGNNVDPNSFSFNYFDNEGSSHINIPVESSSHFSAGVSI